jgi:hypothetical protein
MDKRIRKPKVDHLMDNPSYPNPSIQFWCSRSKRHVHDDNKKTASYHAQHQILLTNNNKFLFRDDQEPKHMSIPSMLHAARQNMVDITIMMDLSNMMACCSFLLSQ